MSDLISRSQLLKQIETWGGCVDALRDYIQNMPTAYDIDKVVVELNELDVKSITRYKNGNFGDFDGVEYYIKKEMQSKSSSRKQSSTTTDGFRAVSSCRKKMKRCISALRRKEFMLVFTQKDMDLKNEKDSFVMMVSCG